jgi:hypothetical protein
MSLPGHKSSRAALCLPGRDSLPAALALALSGALAPQQQAPHVNASGAFSLELPARWRQLTPDEARRLSRSGAAGFPADLLDAKPAAFYAYGEVERWLAENRFDGRALSVIRRDGEPIQDDSSLAIIEQFAADYSQGGEGTYELEGRRWTTVGRDAHPAIECLSRRTSAGDPRPFRVLEYYVPSGGATIVLAFRAEANDFETALPEFHRIAATLRFARPPRGARDLATDMLYVAGIAALVGLLLGVLWRRHRR